MGISIHALLAESDFCLGTRVSGIVYFYPRSPCGERRRNGQNIKRRHKFLSTLSLRRATAGIFLCLTFHQHFYPRSPCGERPMRGEHHANSQQEFLSTLSLRRATYPPVEPFKISEFLSTLSLRRATCQGNKFRQGRNISIHALLAESDTHNFSALHNILISIHALLAESDAAPPAPQGESSKFLSTLSLRRATDLEPSSTRRLTFLSTLSLRRATILLQRSADCNYHFYPRSPCGERHSTGNNYIDYSYFYPRSPCGERPIET